MVSQHKLNTVLKVNGANELDPLEAYIETLLISSE